MKFLWTALLSLGLSSLAFANTTITKSEFKWSAEKKLPGKGHHGPISLKSSSLKLDKAGLIESGEFVMDMTTIDNTDVEGEWKVKLVNHLKNEDFFNVEKFPTAKLVLDKQTKKGEVAGKLTIKDVTNPITITFTQGDKEMSGTLTFDRTKWGVKYGSGNFFKELTADKIIQDEVKLDFKLTL